MAAGKIEGAGETIEVPHGDDPTELADDSAPRAGDPDSLIGHVLAGRYQIDRRLGSGGMGAVYAGTHLLLARPIAVKVMRPRHGDDPGHLAQRFVQEARAASGIAHAHVVQITDFGVAEDGTAFLVMEHLDGEDLAATLQREGPLPWQRVVHIGEQIARALAAAHKQGIIHRDIKPANCFRLTRDDDPDFVKVLDFGLAKVTGDDLLGERSLTQTGALLGTPGYIAPELYRGLVADHRVDIYALGALMYKLMTGELPPMRFVAGNSGVANLKIPHPLQAIVRRALAEDPDARYPTAQALAADLKDLARRTGVPLDTSSDVPAASGRLLAVNRDGRRIYFIVGAPVVSALVLAGGLLAYFALARDPAPEPVSEPESAPAPTSTEPAPPAESHVPEDTSKQPPAGATSPPHLRKPRPPAVALPSVLDDTSTGPPAPPAPPALPGVEEAGEGPAPKAPASESPVPSDTPGVDPPKLPPGSPAALQQQIEHECGSAPSHSTLRVEWTAGDDGRLDPATVKALEPPSGLDDAQTCALRVIRRSVLAWTASKTYIHTFEISS